MKKNKYYLFEKLLSFLDSEEMPLNSVLSGYFCKVFQVLISCKPNDVLLYCYTVNPDRVFGGLVRHSYQKSLTEVLSKLLLTSVSEESTLDSDKISSQELDSIKQSYVYKLLQNLKTTTSDADLDFEMQLNIQ